MSRSSVPCGNVSAEPSMVLPCCFDTVAGPSLPVANAIPPIGRPAAGALDADCRLRILLAEDNIVNQRIAEAQLKRLGFLVDTCVSGPGAVEAFSKTHYDLVLMDCQMPEMDGFEATTSIRRLESAGKRIPIIALTANAMQGDRERCVNAGMDDYLTRPTDRRARTCDRAMDARAGDEFQRRPEAMNHARCT